MLVDEKGNIAAAIEYNSEEDDHDAEEEDPFGNKNEGEENNMKEIPMM